MQIDIPGYKIISTLGQGGMATVYLAIQTCFEREVALKVMSPTLSSDPSFGERFLREARIVSRLMHPNIVTVYDVGIHEGLHYLSMEYLPGRDLKHKRFELNMLESLRVVKDIARALDYAGRKGYVHRDVKPENIMLLDEDGRAVLMDFGIARPADVASGMTQTGTAIGTPHYMSPEQAKGVAVDSRADLYSLGVVLFVLLAGYVPFDADSAVVVGIKHVSEPIPRLPEHLQVFQPVIDRIMAKDPDARYQTGSELIADLDIISSEQIFSAMQIEDRVLEAEGDELSPTMVNPPPFLAGEQIVRHFNTADGEDVAAADAPAIDSSELIMTGESDRLFSSKLSQADLAPASQPESFSISDEERADHRSHTEIEQPPRSAALITLGVLVAIIGSGFYFKSDLRDYWQRYTQPLPTSTQSSPLVHDANTSESVQSSSVDAFQAQDSRPMESTNPVEASPIVQSIDPGEASDYPGLLQQAQQLRKKLDTDLNVATDLVVAYRAAISGTDAEEQDAGRRGLEELQGFYTAAIQTHTSANELSKAENYAESARHLFAETERNTALAESLAALDAAWSLTFRLEQAKEYIAVNALDSPAGQNALEIYRALLAEDPDSADANAGIQAVAQRYGHLAQTQEKKGDVRTALKFIEKGLALAPADSAMIQQRKSLQAQEQQLQQREQALLSKAKSQHISGKVIEPTGDNAYETYRELLAQDVNNKPARDGIASIEQTLITNIQGLIERHRLLDAVSVIASARERFPQSQALLSLKLRAEQLLENNKPAIARVLISNNDIVDINQDQLDVIAADRLIYIGFEYRNFKESTSVLQAILYDGSRSLQMAHVPVIVSGKEGTQFFRIEQPISGFSEGGYNVDLMLGSELLITAPFRVQR